MASEKVLYKAEDGTLINLSTKVINNTTTDSTTDALSAAQGKVLASKFTTLTKSSVGLGNVDNTADADKSVKAATKLQTYKGGSTTETYGDSYPLYAQWQSDNTVKLTCDNYKTRTDLADKASTADSATSAGSASSATTASKLGSATVGSASTPIYLNGGTATACTDVPKKPIYSTTDLTAGSSDLATGQLYLVYE